MKAKVGDKVRIIGNMSGHGFLDGEVVMISEKQGHKGRYKTEFLDGSDYWFIVDADFEPITPPDTISTQIKARMDEHMSNGEYVRAVNWAQVLEMVEGLEDD